MENDRTSEDSRRRGPFAVDEGRALDALELAWGEEYDEIWVCGGEWGAHRKGGGDDDVVTGTTPDELNAKIQADRAHRGAR